MNYQEKYFKYKNKYLQLKNIQLGGASFSSGAAGAAGGSGATAISIVPSGVDRMHNARIVGYVYSDNASKVLRFVQGTENIKYPNGAIYEINYKNEMHHVFIHPVITLLDQILYINKDLITNTFNYILKTYTNLDIILLIKQVLYNYILHKLDDNTKEYIYSQFIRKILDDPRYNNTAKNIIIEELELISKNNFQAPNMGDLMPNLKTMSRDGLDKIPQIAKDILDKMLANDLSDFQNHGF